MILFDLDRIGPPVLPCKINIITEDIMKTGSKDIKLSSFALFIFAPVLLFFHPSLTHTSGFLNGFAHPLSGADHMIAMAAIGIWAYQVGGKGLWLIPLSFVAMMLVGGIIGIMGIHIPLVETGIILSILTLGVLIFASAKLPLVFGMLIAGVFALFHGHSHGTEIPMAASGFAYVAGFVVCTILLHLSGIALGMTAGKISKERMLRYAGIPIVAAGIILMFV